jgi:glutamate-1-semialdehyde 2,1-aminomutase
MEEETTASGPRHETTARSAALACRATHVLPGGNTRHTVYFPPHPRYAVRGEGCHVVDADGRHYIDCVNNMSALLHGHCHPAIVAAVTAQARTLMSVAMPTESEIALAEVLCERVASVERVRFTNSGTEAVMLAIRAARAATGRSRIAKLEGAYHGAADAVSISVKSSPPAWGDAAAPAAVPDSAGIPVGTIADTLVLPANDVANSRRLLEAHATELAAVIVDPVIPRMGFLPLTSEYVGMLREVTEQRGILLIFDEVFSFRIGYGGVQGELGIRPDLTTFGKIIGGGLPVGALGGSAELMAVFDATRGAPRVDHGGTFNGNPLTMTAGIAALRLWTPSEVNRLNGLGHRLRAGLRRALDSLGISAVIRGSGSLSALLFVDGPADDHRGLVAGLQRANGKDRASRLHRHLLTSNVMITPSGGFILSTPMDEPVIDHVIEAVGSVLAAARPAPT